MEIKPFKRRKKYAAQIKMIKQIKITVNNAA